MKTTLLKIDNTGAVREWGIEVDGDSYRTHYGQRGGQIVSTEWTVCEGKNIGRSNETSPEEQALSEVESIIISQREKGYSEKANKVKFAVMLAKNYSDYKDKIKYSVYSQPKLDGARMYANINGLFSRNHKLFVSTPHIFEELKPYFEKYSDLVLDGECYNPTLKDNFNRIMSLVKKTKPTKEDLEESKKHIQFWIYDVADTSMKFSERTQWLKDNIKETNCIKLLPTDIANNQVGLDKLYESYIDAGNEGQIVRLNEKYDMKRSKSLLKRKEFDDAEYEILDIEEGVGNRSGKAGFMRFQTKEGRPFKSNIKADWQTLEEYLTNKDEYIGKMATIKYFGLTCDDKIPRFPYVIKIHEKEKI
jgi:DNA ligase-1